MVMVVLEGGVMGWSENTAIWQVAGPRMLAVRAKNNHNELKQSKRRVRADLWRRPKHTGLTLAPDSSEARDR
ncbi:hypothetical protein E2C01_032008 [Portunus trituberculatus]|uniref:Uncharacterized protein n=1 Tax=Portunus trituberculatus TaxID=210409 RepID=A0A5B7EUY0_PORTR|nr:hypothetical protein [Portunus trituberculatus]